MAWEALLGAVSKVAGSMLTASKSQSSSPSRRLPMNNFGGQTAPVPYERGQMGNNTVTSFKPSEPEDITRKWIRVIHGYTMNPTKD